MTGDREMTYAQYQAEIAGFNAEAIARSAPMPDTMIERVARELCQCDERNGAAPWDWYKEKGRDDYRERARAVLTAMREPTGAMVDAMVRTHVPEDFENMGCERCFIAAIAAALAEGV
jgi:hypothetical protein